MSRYALWSRQNKRDEREFHEKAYRREGIAEWDARWHTLSIEARLAVLNNLKVPHGARNPGSTRPSVPVSSIEPGVLQELVSAGLVEIGGSRMIGPRDRIFTADAAIDFMARVRALNRHRLLRDGGLAEFKKYVDHGFFSSVTLNVLNDITRRAGIHEYMRLDELLSRYVTSRYWPKWSVASVVDPFAARVIKLIEDAEGPVPLRALSERIPDVPPDSLWTSVSRLIACMAVFEDLDPKSLDIVVGLLPAVREAKARANEIRVRPPLVRVETPREFGPDGSIIVDDLRAFLLEVASDPPRLRQDKALFQKEADRFLDAQSPLPAWLAQDVLHFRDSRLDKTHAWARALHLVRERVDGKEMRLDLSPTGSEWLANPLEKQYQSVFSHLNLLPSSKNRGSYEDYDDRSGYYSGIGGYYHGVGDDRFLGSHVIVIRKGNGKSAIRYWEAKPEDYKALRDSIDRAFEELPIGVYFTLESVLAHLSFGDANPLYLGLRPDNVEVFQSGRPVPPIEEQREEMARSVLDTFTRARLIPLGCVQTALDGQDRLCIARQPRLDAYFGRAVGAEKMAGVTAGESRVVVQPDFSLVIIGLNPAPAAELAPFCERSRKGSSPGAQVLKLTRESVIKAVAGGMKPEEITNRLKRRASNEVPANVLREVRDWAGWVRRVRTTTQLLIRCPDRETADRVIGVLKKKGERLNETTVALEVARLTPAERIKLREQGIVVESK